MYSMECEPPTENEADKTKLLEAVQQHMRQQQWNAAAELLKPSATTDASLASQFNICRNLASLQKHRLKVYAAVVASAGPQRYITGTSASGHPTIFKIQANGTTESMSPCNQPVAALSSIFAAIKTEYQAAKALGILGIGDGYLLKSCALHPPVALFGFQQSIYLFEPDAQAILACMSIHDYTGPQGPIEAERFRWFVGPQCREMARETLLGERFNPPPLAEVRLATSGDEAGAIMGDIL